MKRTVKSKYQVLVKITIFLSIIAVSMSMINYYASLNSAQKQLKTILLPLSVDNIYTEIQENIVQPYIISSMMANDTFVRSWLKNSEHNTDEITKYLSAIQNKYNTFGAFLISDATKEYYTQKGFIEILSLEKKQNKWYFDYANNKKRHVIDIDSNENLSNSLMIFINYKIFDAKDNFLGVTGVVLEIASIKNMLKKFRELYGFKVTFFNESGKVVLSEKDYTSYKTIDDCKILKASKDKIISKQSNKIEHKINNQTYLIQTKYMKELDLYITIEAKLSEHIEDSLEMIYFNLLSYLGLVLFVMIVLYRIIHKHSKKLEDMAFFDPLTNLYNRRFFETKLSSKINDLKRKKEDFSVVFIDIDNFKIINDTKGHNIGDEILMLVSNLLREFIREVDTIARWGGEEIVILLSNTNIKDAQKLTEKLRLLLENNSETKEILSFNVTASFGVTEFIDGDDADSIVKRADAGMYISKNSGKNKVSII